jgi:DNA-directed RNA polymerase specialized sigma54-like protein
MNDTFFQNSEKTLTPVNTTQTLADELKTSTDTASRIIQIQAKADVFGFGVCSLKNERFWHELKSVSKRRKTAVFVYQNPSRN